MSAARGTGSGTAVAWTADEMMIIAAARTLRDGQTCLVSAAVGGVSGGGTAVADLARRLHAPNLTVLDESGALGVGPGWSASIRDGSRAAAALGVIGLPELLNYWLQPGRVDVGFLTAVQLDRFGNINNTLLSDAVPIAWLFGAGGAPEIAASCREVIVVLPHRRRTFVERVDFVTAAGPGERAVLGLPPAATLRVVTDLGVLEPDPRTAELVLTALHPGVPVEQAMAETGWTLQIAADLTRTAPPTAGELVALRTTPADVLLPAEAP